MSETTSTQPVDTTPSRAAAAVPGPADSGRGGAMDGLKPLLLDVAVPLGSYYLLHDAFGLGLVLSLALGSVVPAVRTLWSVVKERRVNGLAGLMLAVNVAGIALSFVTGNPRIMVAKDSGISSVIGICLLASAITGKPLLSAGLKPWLVKGDTARAAAWERLSAGSRRFRSLERRFSAVWGAVLLAECVARLIGAFTLPVSTMVWLSTVITVAGLVAGALVSGVASIPMDTMLTSETRTEAETETETAPAA